MWPDLEKRNSGRKELQTGRGLVELPIKSIKRVEVSTGQPV